MARDRRESAIDYVKLQLEEVQTKRRVDQARNELESIQKHLEELRIELCKGCGPNIRERTYVFEGQVLIVTEKEVRVHQAE